MDISRPNYQQTSKNSAYAMVLVPSMSYLTAFERNSDFLFQKISNNSVSKFVSSSSVSTTQLSICSLRFSQITDPDRAGFFSKISVTISSATFELSSMGFPVSSLTSSDFLQNFEFSVPNKMVGRCCMVYRLDYMAADRCLKHIFIGYILQKQSFKFSQLMLPFSPDTFLKSFLLN